MYERAADLLRLTLLLQGSRTGLSLDDIGHEFRVSRRTAERLRDAALHLFPAIEEVPDSAPLKRWRLPNGHLGPLAAVRASELEELRLAAERLEDGGLPGCAASVRLVATKLRAQQTARVLTRLEPDLEALMEAEGHAMRAGPRPAIQPEVLEGLREALIGCTRLRLRYRRRGDGRITMVEVDPHGVLFGHRHYLVAFPAGGTAPLPRLYALGNILQVALTDVTLTRRAGFDLRAYAARAFGVFQDEAVTEVVWRFPPGLAADAREHHFHPSECKVELPDGGLELRFTACGLWEMAWHLFTWGPGVEVVEPRSLRERYAAMLRDALATMD